MGGGSVPPEIEDAAFTLGRLIAENRWILLNGGRNCGVMDASARGARSAGGMTIGVLPGESRDDVSEGVDIAILTGMGNARNCINVLSSDVVVACPGGAGTLSEIALAVKSGRPVVLFRFDLPDLFGDREAGRIYSARTPEEVITRILEILRQAVDSRVLRDTGNGPDRQQ